MKKYNGLFLAIFLIISLSVGTIIYGKTTLKHVDYNGWINSSFYEYIPEEMYISLFPELKEFLLSLTTITTKEDITSFADYILIVENKQEKELKGNGIINYPTVLSVIKGNEELKGKTIPIYDLLFQWDAASSKYLGGSVPIRKNEKYIVFLKKAHNPTIPDSYVFISPQFGHLPYEKEDNILYDYEPVSLKINEIMEYDYIATENEQIDKIMKLRNDLRKKFIK